LPEDSDQSGIVGATIVGMAAAASLEEEQPEVEEVVELEAAAQVHEEDITGLPEWLADLEEGITQPTEDETWTPERAAMTQPLTTPEEIPQREVQAPESFAAEPAKPEVARLDINQASLVELERLPGVGFIRAQALIEYRQANGPFESMLDLENVEGFDPDLVDVLRDYATILPRTQEIYPKYTGSGAQASLSNARQALTDGNVDEAIGIYQALMSDTDLLPEVVKDLNDALYRYPVDVSIWMTLGDAEMRSGQTQEALDAYTKAEELLR
jgi:competence ComEA-like helix-hairpin-helix protein